jgi:hypothetical protein
MTADESVVLFLVGNSKFRSTRSVHGFCDAVQNEVFFFAIPFYFSASWALEATAAGSKIY